VIPLDSMRRARREAERLVDLMMLGKSVLRSRAGAGDERSFHVLPGAIPEHIDDEDTHPIELQLH
jgi:hypothetical protein